MRSIAVILASKRNIANGETWPANQLRQMAHLKMQITKCELEHVLYIKGCVSTARNRDSEIRCHAVTQRPGI